MIKIEKKLIKYNFSKGNNPKYIVVHDTGNPNKGADAEAHYRYFSSGPRGASAHYFVDDHSIIQTVDDSDASWHCGDGKGKYGITNYNSIGIEICINSDGDYDKAVQSTIELVELLMKRHNISLDKVVRHYDASRKNCPGTMSSNNWEKWNWFKGQLKSSSDTATVNLIGFYRVRKSWDDAVSQVGAYKVFENAKTECDKHPGYSVFNEAGDKVYPIPSPVPEQPKETEQKPADDGVPQWQKDAFKKLVEKKIINTPEAWENRLGETITTGEVMGIIANML